MSNLIKLTMYPFDVCACRVLSFCCHVSELFCVRSDVYCAMPLSGFVLLAYIKPDLNPFGVCVCAEQFCCHVS